MSINNKNPNLNKFFNKLYISFPIISNISETQNIINNYTTENFNQIKYIYTNKDSDKWFAKSENGIQEIFLFGKIYNNTPQTTLLTLTFDKVLSYSDKCSGIINTKQIYLKTQYFIDNYPNFKTKLTELTIDVFIDKYANTIDVIKLGSYAENIDEFLRNLDILLDELENYTPIKRNERLHLKKESIITKNVISESNLSNNKSCEICGKKLKKREKKVCRKCSKKRHAAKILKKLLTHVPPQTPFTRKDLNQIYSEEREINDCIWSLQDYNLIQQNNGEYYLDEKDTLDKFISKYDILEELIEKKEKKEEHKKLNKQCIICKKTLPTSKFYKNKKTNDGLEDYCKNCKRYVNAANYLKDILNHVSPGSEFKSTDIPNNFENPMEFTGRLWELQDFDLITYDSDKNIYFLTDLETCQQFLDEYFISGSVPVKIETKKEDKTEKDEKNEQMNSVIESIRNGKTDKEAAEIAGIKLYNITYWFNNGKNNIGEENIVFYKRYIEAKQEAKLNSFNKFYVIESFNNKRDLTIADTLRKQQMENVLKEIGSGSSMKTAAFNSNIPYETLQNWYKCGKQNFGEEYVEFFEKINVLQSPIESPKRKYNSDDFDIDFDLETESKTTSAMNGHILDPLPKEYEDTFKSSKNNKTGFAWVNKVGNQWFYTRNIGGQTVKLSNYDIYKLHEEVLEKNMIWGVRNLAKAKKSLKEPIKTKPISSPKSSKKLITINVPVDKNDKKRLKLLSEHKNKSMRDLITAEAENILIENKIIKHHIKPKNNAYLLFQIDKELKNQVNEYSSNFNDFWNTALDNILNENKPDVKVNYNQNNIKFNETTLDLDFHNTVENTQHNLVTINVKVDKRDKNKLKLISESSNTSMKDLLNNEALKILNENKPLLHFSKIGDTAPLLFQLDENLKKQIENYSLKNNKNVRDFWYTALYNITQTQKSKNITSDVEQLEINKNYSKNDITITYVRLENNEIITIIQGLLDSNELINSLNQMKIFEDNISRIITNKNNDGIDLFIEINIPLNYINKFEEITGNLNWKINN